MKNLTIDEALFLKEIIDYDLCDQHNAILDNIDQNRRYDLMHQNILSYDNDIDEIEYQNCHNDSSDERWFIADSFISKL